MHTVNMIVHNACQLVTCAGTNTPKRGVTLGDVGIIKNGALAIEDGIIAAVGTADDILSNYRASTRHSVSSVPALLTLIHI